MEPAVVGLVVAPAPVLHRRRAHNRIATPQRATDTPGAQSRKRALYTEACSAGMRIRRTTGSPFAYAPIAVALPAYVGVPPHTTWQSTQFTVSGTDSSSGGGSCSLPAWWTEW